MAKMEVNEGNKMNKPLTEGRIVLKMQYNAV